LSTPARVATLPAPAQLVWIETFASAYGPYNSWANLTGVDVVAMPTVAPVAGGIQMDTNLLVSIANLAAQTPIAPTPRAVVTMPPPTPRPS
jgi:hypothetical protein